MLDTRRRGIAIAAITAVISGFAVFVNGYGVRSWRQISDATTYTTFKNLVAASVLLAVAGVLTRRGSAEGLGRPTSGRQWLGLGVVAVVGGAIPFALFFEGLGRASSSQAAFIHKTLIIWVALLAARFLSERVGPLHLVAIGLLVGGQVVLVGGVAGLSVGSGELMILGATLMWSVEVIIAKKLLEGVSSLTVGVSRMAGGSVLLVLYALARGTLGDIGAVTGEQLIWVVVTGVVLAGYVGSWFAALARAQAIDVTAVLIGGAVITALLQFGVAGVAVPSLAGLGLVAAGAAVAAAAGSRRVATAS